MVGRFNFLKRLWPVVAYLASLEIAAIGTAYALGVPLTGPSLCLFVVVFLFNPFILPAAEMYDPSLAIDDASLTEKANRMARVMDIDCLPVKVLVGPVGKDTINAFCKEKSIFITSRAVLELSDAAVLFMLGHEIGHLRHNKDLAIRLKNRPPVKWPFWLFLALLTAFCVSIRLEIDSAAHILLIVLLVGSAIPLVWLQGKDPVTSKEIELFCDRIGAELCGDPQAALEALDRMTEKETDRQAKLSGYPTRGERLAQVRGMLSS